MSKAVLLCKLQYCFGYLEIFWKQERKRTIVSVLEQTSDIIAKKTMQIKKTIRETFRNFFVKFNMFLECS